MGLWQAQSAFTNGELDPKLYGRVDLEAYYKGVQEATNVLAIPQGGLKKRGGMKFLGEALGGGRLENFSFNVEQNYLLVFTDLRMQIYKDGVLQTNINGSGNDYLVVPWAIEDIPVFDYIQSADTIIITHEDYEPRQIQRTSDTDWTIATVAITNIPQFDFNDASSPTPVDEVQEVKFTNANDGDRFKISLEGILTDEIVLNRANTDSTEVNIQQAMLDLPNTGNSGVTVTFQSASPDIYRITFSGESANDWDEVSGTPVFTKETTFEIITSTISNGTARSEDTWSGTRGWPRTCTFHEGRLWFGGSLSRPSTIWGSVVNDPFNFDVGRSRDDEGITATLATDQVNAINAIISNRSLQVFTSGAEFYVPASPITPETIAVKPQTNLGSKRVRPVITEGLTLFLQRTGRALYQFQFVDEFQSNESKSLSVLSPHLINNPIQMASQKGTSSEDANYVYILGDNGELTVFNLLTFEGVQAFTRVNTDGNIKSVAVVDDEVYYLVEREINSSTVFYVERNDNDLNTDSSVIGTGLASDTLTGLDHLEGETVEVKADGAVQPPEVVSSGQITISRDADTIEAGLQYRPSIRTMPFNVNLNDGPHAAQKKRILRAAIRLFESNGVTVNGYQLADRTIGQDQFDAPIPQSEYKRIFLHGWSLEASVLISQDAPMPMTILSIDLEVKT